MRPGVVGGAVWRGEQPGPDQEVRPPEQERPDRPPVRQQHSLEDDVDVVVDGGQRGRRRVRLRPFRDLGHLPAVRTQPGEHRRLVFLAPRHEVFKADVERMRKPDLAARVEQVEVRQVAARDVVGDVTRRQPQPSTDKLHDAPVVTRRRVP